MASSYVLGGPSSSLAPSSGGWAWSESQLSSYRSAITNPANFGPSGIVKTSISTSFLTTINSATLATLDGFIAPWWDDANAAPYVSSVTSFFLGGGDLVLLQDDSTHDAIGAALGVPTSSTSSFVWSITPTIFEESFGNVGNFNATGSYGQLSATNVASRNGTVFGTNSLGEVTGAFWDDGQYAAGAGKLLIIADVDAWTSFGGATYSPNNAKGRFALNATELVVGDTSVVPEPSGAVVPLFVLAGLVSYRRRFSRQV